MNIRKKILSKIGMDYGASPYADPRKPYQKPYNEMSRLEQRIHKRIRLVSWLATLAGVGFGVLLVLIVRALNS